MEQQVQLLNQAALVSVSVPRAKEVPKLVPVEHLTVPSSCSELLDEMARLREKCDRRGLVPLYHFTSPPVAPSILKGGFRMSTQGLGDGGVTFANLGPASYDLGSPEYEDNIISDCFGKERLEEYRGQHKLDVCLVYGMEPSVLQQAPGGRDNAKMVSKATFADLALSQADGSYYLRPDRILAAFLLDPKRPPLGKEALDSEFEAEAKRDAETKESLGSPGSLLASPIPSLGAAAEEVDTVSLSKAARLVAQGFAASETDLAYPGDAAKVHRVLKGDNSDTGDAGSHELLLNDATPHGITGGLSSKGLSRGPGTTI
jgi:hypothetical protein